MSHETWVAIIAAILGGGGVFFFLQFVVAVCFRRKEKNKELETKIE